MFKALFSAKGRMRRRDWWLWSIGLMLIFFLAGMLVHRLFGTQSVVEEIASLGKEPLTPFQGWVIFANTLGYWPYVCITAKRGHDRNRSAWLAVLWPCIGIPYFIMQHAQGLIDPAGWRFVAGAVQFLLSIATIGVFIALVVDCGILDGTKGPNKYGPSPKGLGEQPEDVF